MKKHYLLLSLIGIFFSCSQEDYLSDNLTVDSEKPQKELKVRGDGEYDVLGYGYDIMGDYLAISSIKYPVVDVKKVANSNLNCLDIADNSVRSDYNFYYGSDALDYVKEINKKVVSKNGGSATSPILGGKLLGFTATANFETEDSSKYTYISKNSYARSERLIIVKDLKMAALPTQLTNYLSDPFNAAVQNPNITPQQIVEKFGTHVLLNIAIGGKLITNFQSTYLEEESYEKKRKQVEAGLDVTLKFLKFNTDNKVTSTTTVTDNQKNITQRVKVQAFGGVAPITVDVSYDQKNQAPPNITIGVKEWQDYFSTANGKKGVGAELVQADWKEAYPIYEFIADPIRKAQVKLAYENYLSGNQVNELKVKPIYGFSYKGDWFYVFSQDGILQQLGAGRNYEGLFGYVLANAEPNSVPIYSMASKRRGDTFLVATTESMNSYMRTGDYIFYQLEGYAFRNQVGSTIPMFSMWWGPSGDTFCSFGWDDANHQAKNGRQILGTLGYVFPR